MNAQRPAGVWPAWVDDILAFGPVAELETEWRAEIGDAITRVLDLRAGAFEVYHCPVLPDGRTPCLYPKYRRAPSGGGGE